VAWSDYVLGQFPAIAHYLRLAFWPTPLVFDYGTRWTSPLGSPIPGMVVVVGLLAATIHGLRRRPALGFLGVCFFAILAPTSLIPGNRQALAEHRMYLALIPVVVAAVMAIRLGAHRQSRVVLAVLAILLGFMTSQRNLAYQSDLALWSDTVAKCPGNFYARNWLGQDLAAAGDWPAAAAQFRESIRLNPSLWLSHDGLAFVLRASGQADEAKAEFAKAQRLRPRN